jgi:hypothetical protein
LAGELGSEKAGRPTAESDTTASPSNPSAVRPPVTLSARINFWSTLITAFTAAIALILSITTYAQVNSRAEISMAMPNAIVLWSHYRSGRQANLSVVIKPSFNVDKKTDVAAAVMGATLELEPPPGANRQSMTLTWKDLVELRDNDKGALVRLWRASAEPFLVTQDAREARAMEFTFYDARDKLNIVAGRWNASLTVQRLGQDALIRRFCINVADDTAQALNDGIKKDGKWSGLQFVNDLTPNPPQAGAKESSDDCYEVI